MNGEQMLQAARIMSQAADTMQRTQGYQQEAMNQWLIRFEQLVERLESLKE